MYERGTMHALVDVEAVMAEPRFAREVGGGLARRMRAATSASTRRASTGSSLRSRLESRSSKARPRAWTQPRVVHREDVGETAAPVLWPPPAAASPPAPRAPAASRSRSSLSATLRSSVGSYATYTTPMPPAPAARAGRSAPGGGRARARGSRLGVGLAVRPPWRKSSPAASLHAGHALRWRRARTARLPESNPPSRPTRASSSRHSMPSGFRGQQTPQAHRQLAAQELHQAVCLTRRHRKGMDEQLPRALQQLLAAGHQPTSHRGAVDAIAERDVRGDSPSTE